MTWQDDLRAREWDECQKLARKLSRSKKQATSLGPEDYAAEAIEKLLEQENRLANIEGGLALTINRQYIDRFKLAIAFQRVTNLGKKLVVVTGTPDEGKEEFRVVMAGVGLEYRETPPTMGAAFVVQANISPGMSKIRRAIELGVPVLSESDALLLVEKLRGH